MTLTIRLYQNSDQKAWDSYVKEHPEGTLYHLSQWKTVIEKTYGHDTYFLMAIKDNAKRETRNKIEAGL